jgi:hypothetical protein
MGAAIRADGLGEFFKLDVSVLDDKLVIKMVKCAMQEWNGEFIESIK